MSGLILVAMLVVLALLAPRYGTHSRDESGWSGKPSLGGAPRRTPRSDPLALRRTGWRALRAAASAVASVWREQQLACEALMRVQQPWLAEHAARQQGPLYWRSTGRGHWRLEGRTLPIDQRFDR